MSICIYKSIHELTFNHAAASSSALPPISPIIIIPCNNLLTYQMSLVYIYHIYMIISTSVSGSLVNLSRQSMKLVPLKGSPPIPTHVDCPRPAAVVWCTASYVKVPLRDTTPIFPFLWMYPGIIPILHSPTCEITHTYQTVHEIKM